MIHALCLVKNEEDIIKQSLLAASRWCDWIYVFDNGSHDRTWELVQSLARRHRGIVPFMQNPVPFDDALRNEILSHYASRARSGDWWCILDADEFYIDHPPEFLKRVPPRYKSVYGQSYNYLFTSRDLGRYFERPDEGKIPVEDRLRYFSVGDYSPMRFFRHEEKLSRVPSEGAYPIYPKRIRFKHYPYRSPEQIALRLKTRISAMQRGEFLHEKRSNWVRNGVIVPGPAEPHDIPTSWEERIVPAWHCFYDNGDGRYPEAPWLPPEPRVDYRRLRYESGRFIRRLNRVASGRSQRVRAILNRLRPLG
jgi:glycosyltransferase involved in cell wall biosynthesis